MAEYVAYSEMSPVSDDSEKAPTRVFESGDVVTQKALNVDDATWEKYVRRGQVVEKGSANDPSTFHFESGVVGIASQQAEAVRLNMETEAANPKNRDVDDEVAAVEAARAASADRTPLLETTLALDEEKKEKAKSAKAPASTDK
jgi:hypothetical protein